MVAAMQTLPSPQQLDALWIQKYGPAERAGRLPTRRRRAGYFLPADVYETLVGGLIGDGSRWLDVGGGQVMFAHNADLARTVAARCTRVVVVDPSANVHANTIAHERVQCALEDFQTDERFDVATMRMVVEHVSDPPRFVAALGRLVKPGGAAVVFTVDRRSPTALVSRLIPFTLHHRVKRMFWAGEEHDTFPVHYRMNTPGSLRQYFEQAGFAEELSARPDDLSVFSRFGFLGGLELAGWRICRALRLPYPEGCLLAVYRRRLDR